MRWCNDRDHEIGSWRYLTKDLSHLITWSRVPHSTLNSLQRGLKVISCSSRGRWQMPLSLFSCWYNLLAFVPLCSWQKLAFPSLFLLLSFLLVFFFLVRSEVISCHVSKQARWSQQWLQSSNESQWAPKGTQEGEEYLLSSSHQTRLLPEVSPREARDVKTQDSGPRQRRCIWKEGFQWAQTLTSSCTEKR